MHEWTEVAFPAFDEYREYIDGDGTTVYHDKKTGQDLPAVMRAVPAGSVVLTPAKIAAQRAYKERGEFMRRQAAEKKEWENKAGPYIFAASDRDTFEPLAPDTMARAVYLASFLQYGTDALMKSQRVKIKRSQLHNVLRLSERVSDHFWNEVQGRYFVRDEDGTIRAKTNAFFRGKLHALPSAEFQRVYIKAVRELYEKIPAKQHKRLGYALKMLPYLNLQYNILCYNPEEAEFKKVVPMTVAEFCAVVGHDVAHAAQLARDYGKMTFTVDGRQEVFCKFMSDGRDITKANIYVNPALVFKGKDFRQVAAIGVAFAADSRPA